jgi:hypothetical protein
VAEQRRQRGILELRHGRAGSRAARITGAPAHGAVRRVGRRIAGVQAGEIDTGEPHTCDIARPKPNRAPELRARVAAVDDALR